MTTKIPRGIRNNNPGNIRRSTDKWRGLSERQDDDEFFQFISSVFGLRAMAIILLKYQGKYGLRTVASIINRWAPPKENDTKAYIESIAESLGKEPDEEISLSNASTLYLIISAMVRHENGQQPYGRDTIIQAIQMAGVK